MTTLKKLQELEARLQSLEQENVMLKMHKPYGILTRAGFEIEQRTVTGTQYVAFSDLDDMHGLNAAHGYETVNEKIRSALQLRSDDLILTGLWFSGDEIVFIIRNNPKGFCARVQQSFADHGIGITLAYEEIADGNINAAIDIAARRVQGMKEQRRKS